MLIQCGCTSSSGSSSSIVLGKKKRRGEKRRGHNYSSNSVFNPTSIQNINKKEKEKVLPNKLLLIIFNFSTLQNKMMIL